MEEEKDFKAFCNAIHGKRTEGKINNCWGVYDAYKLIRKHKWYDIGRPLKEHEFYAIVREMNKLLALDLSLGITITFPCRMGKVELRRATPEVKMKNGKLRVTYPVDWASTLKLWYTDQEARNNKTLIRMETDTVYRTKYCKGEANYNNKSFYEFSLNSKLKVMLKQSIKEGLVDTAYEGY